MSGKILTLILCMHDVLCIAKCNKHHLQASVMLPLYHFMIHNISAFFHIIGQLFQVALVCNAVEWVKGNNVILQFVNRKFSQLNDFKRIFLSFTALSKALANLTVSSLLPADTAFSSSLIDASRCFSVRAKSG